MSLRNEQQKVNKNLDLFGHSAGRLLSQSGAKEIVQQNFLQSFIKDLLIVLNNNNFALTLNLTSFCTRW